MPFERHARTVSLLTLVSRVTGLARDATLSRIFGAGSAMDAFFFAFMIPNLFRRLFGEGALAAAFLPVYARLERDDPEMARRLAALTVARLTVGLGVVVLLGEIVLFVISAGHEPRNLALWLLMIMLPYMPMVCVVAILGAMLQVRGRFGPTAAAPVVLNVCIVTAALGAGFALGGGETPADRTAHLGWVSVSVIVAVMLQLAWSMLALRSRPWWTRDYAAAGEPFRDICRRVLPMILGLGVLQVNTLFDGLIAGYPTYVGPTILGHPYPLEEGAMAAVSFAQRLYQFPLGVFGIAVATAIFPSLARQADDARTFADTVRRGLRLVVFIGLPASVGLVLVRDPLTAVVLQGGRFDAADTTRVGFVLLGYAPAIWAYSMVHVLTRAFFARGETMTPVRVAAGVVALNLALNCTLIWTPLREAGLAWSTALCSVVQVVVLTALLRRRVGAVVDASVRGSWAKSLLAAAVMGACVYAADRFAPDFGASWGATLGRLLTLVAVGAAVYGLAAVAARMPELRWALGRR